MPWIVKPLYTMLPDCVPFWGTRRKSYLLILIAVSALAYLVLSLPDHGALMVLVAASLGIACCDVVIDGKVSRPRAPSAMT